MPLLIGAYSLLLFVFVTIGSILHPEGIAAMALFGIFFVEGMLGGLFGESHNVTLIIAVLTVLCALWLLSRNRRIIPEVKLLSSLEWLYGLLLALMWVSWLYTLCPEYGMFKVQKLTLTLLPTVLAGRICFSTPQSARATTSYLASFSLLMIPWMMLYYLAWGYAYSSDSRFSGGAAIVLGNILVIGVFLAIYIVQTNPKLFAVSLMAIVFWSAMLLLSGSRSAILGLVIALVVTLARFKHILRLLGWMVVLMIIGLAVYRFMPKYNEGVSRLTDTDLEGTGRPALFTTAIDIFLEHPVKGVGVGGFAAYTGGDKRDYPHNLVLEVLCEQGIVGGVPLGILLTMALWRFFRIRQIKFASQEDKVYMQPVLQVVMLMFMVGLCQSMVTADSPMFYVLYFFMGALWGCTIWTGSFEREAAPEWQLLPAQDGSSVRAAV